MSEIRFEAQDIDSQLSGVTDGILAQLGAEEQKSYAEAQAMTPGEGQAPESDEDMDEVPNGKIRLEKMKAQRDAERMERQRLAMELENIKGKLSVLEQKPTNSEESAEDPTEYMSDVEKLLYKNNLELQNQLKQITDKINGFENKEVKKELNTEEEVFFKNNPELAKKREEVLEEIEEFAKEQPVWIKMLRDRQISVAQLYAAMKARNNAVNPAKTVRDASNVFGGSRRTPAGGGQTSNGQDDGNMYKKIVGTLQDRHSTNKDQATTAFMDILTNDIVSLLD